MQGEQLEMDMPPPAPPVGKKSDIFDPVKFEDVDKRAAEAPGKLLHSFPDLVSYLTEGLTSDLSKLRSIFFWIGNQELLDASQYSMTVDEHTPYYSLKKIAQNRGSGCNELFQDLCSLAKLPCKVLHGYSTRVTGYVPGDAIENHNTTWTVVYVDGSWRIVDIESAFTGVVKTSRDLVLLEETGKAVRKREEDKVNFVKHMNEFWFLADPEDFIHFYLPEDPAWQLLPEPWSKEKFIKSPKVTWMYLKSGWHLADRHESVVEALEGVFCISMDQVPEGQFTVGYKLFYNEKRSKKSFPDQLQLDNYIRTVGSRGEQSVMARLPQAGLYNLQIQNGNKNTLCEFSIKSTGKINGPKPFPPIPETGLGFNQAAIDAGLVDPSRDDGLVVAREGEKVRFRFRTKKPLEVVARLVHRVLPSQQLDSRVRQEEEDGTITITVIVPFDAHNPEFTLQVDARPKDTQKAPMVNVLNYLLTHDRQLVNARRGREHQLQDELASATAGDDLHRLESAIREFRAGHMKDDALYEKAYNRLVHLHRTAVEGALTDENKLATALSDVDQSQVVFLLHKADWLQNAHITHRRMKRLSSMKHEVQKLSPKQVNELQVYNHPPEGIKDTLVATFLLLGENMKKLKKWSNVQTLLRLHGKGGIMYRIQNYEVSSKVDMAQLDLARSLLDSSTREELRCKSVSAAAFYAWSREVVDTMQIKDDNNSPTSAKEEEAQGDRLNQ